MLSAIDVCISLDTDMKPGNIRGRKSYTVVGYSPLSPGNRRKLNQIVKSARGGMTGVDVTQSDSLRNATSER